MTNTFPTSRSEYKELSLELIRFLKTNIEDTTGQLEWSDRNFNLLRKFSIDKGALDYPTAKGIPSKDSRKQLLWDFVAYTPDKGILIAAESEHGEHFEGLKADFRKLFYVRSPVKLFMCRMKTFDGHIEIREKLFALMQSECSNYSPGEIFIVYFVWWAGETKENRDKAYWLQVDGGIDHVTLHGEQFVEA